MTVLCSNRMQLLLFKLSLEMESHQRSKVISRHNGVTLFFLLTFPFCLLELVWKDIAVSFEIHLLTYVSGCRIHLLCRAMSLTLVL